MAGHLLLLLETSDIAARYTAAAARRLGLSPLFVCDLSRYQGDTRRQLACEPSLDAETEEPEAIAAALARAGVRDVFGVTTLADVRLETATRLAAHLGVRGLDPVVLTLKDKARVAELVPEHAPRTVPFLATDPDPAVVVAPLFDAGGRVILKPRRGAGGAGVLVLDGADELATMAARIGGLRLPRSFDDGTWVAQAFVPGDLVSVEGYVTHGSVRTLGFTDRRKVGATESGAGFPARVSPDVAAIAHDALELLVARSGLSRAWFHVELVSGPSGTFLIDANVGRIGGGPMGDLISIAFDVDPVDLYQHVLEVSLFGEASADPFAGKSPVRRAYSILYGMEQGGVLSAVDVPAGLRSRHHAILERGENVPAMGTDDWAWVGILTGEDGVVQEEIERISIIGPGGAAAAVWLVRSPAARPFRA